MSNLLVDFHRNGGASLRREGKKSSWIEAMEIDGLYILRTMLESDDSYEGKSEQGVMAVTMVKEAVRESALWHFRLVHLGVNAV